MSECRTSRNLLVLNGQYGIVHLSEALDDSEYLIQYALSESVDNQDKYWSDIIVAGKKLVLTTANTPLVLNLPGAYRFIENSPSGGTIRTAAYSVAGFSKGDIK